MPIRSSRCWDVGNYLCVLDRLTLDSGIDRLSRNVSNRQFTLRDIPEQRRPQLIICYQDVIFKEILILSIVNVLHFAACCSRLFSKFFVQHESLRAHVARVLAAPFCWAKGGPHSARQACRTSWYVAESDRFWSFLLCYLCLLIAVYAVFSPLKENARRK